MIWLVQNIHYCNQCRKQGLYRSIFNSFILKKMLLVYNASIFILNNIFCHSQREAVDEIRRISPNNSFSTRLVLQFCDDVPHLLNPISHEIYGLVMTQLVGSHDVLRVHGRQVFLEGLNVYFLIEVKVAHLSLIILEALRPFGGVDELYSKLVIVLTFYADQSQQKSFWSERARYGFCSGLDVVDPVNRAETDDCIELSHILELGVQVFLEVAHLGFRTILFLGYFDQIG